MGTLRDLIAIANEVLPNLASDYVVVPEFAKTAHFTILAKAPTSGVGAPTVMVAASSTATDRGPSDAP